MQTSKEDTANTEESNKHKEPLEQESDCLDLHSPIASDSSMVKDSFLDEGGEVMSTEDGVSQYFYKRLGDRESPKKKTIHWRDKRNYCWALDLDKELADKYDNLSTALVTLRVQRDTKQQVDLLDELDRAFSNMFDGTLRYALDTSVKSWEFVVVFACTDKYATPHIHLYILADGELSLDLFRPAIKRFARDCKYSPSNCRGNKVNDGAVRIMGSGNTDTIPRRDRDSVSAGMAYTMQQLPHLPQYSDLDQGEAIHGATCRAWTGGTRFRSSNYSLWEDEQKEPANNVSFSLSRQCKSKAQDFTFTDYAHEVASSSFELSTEQSISLS